ncbi:MAG: cation transporter [Micropruina sp.]|nr:MAG: cation transporter [Micropruina sp.]
MTTSSGATQTRRRTLARRAQWLAGASVAYNLIEGIVAIGAGTVAGSTALIGFGLDSAIEMTSGLVILWQFRHPVPEERELLARRIIAVSFFALAGYVTVESVRALVTAERPAPSVVGIVLTVASLLIMPILSWAQRRTGRQLGSRAVEADGTQTLLCTYLSAAVLLGLLGNALLGWGWLDPVAALVIAGVAVNEGRENWQGEDDCCSPLPGLDGEADSCCAADGLSANSAGDEPGANRAAD